MNTLRNKFRSGHFPHVIRGKRADKFFYIIAFISLGVFRPDSLMILVYCFIYLYLFMTQRKRLYPYLFISTLISVMWTYIARENYHYNQDMLHIFGLNTFPAFAWASGLFGVLFICLYLDTRLDMPNLAKKILLFSIVYWTALISAETISYHIFNIRNLATAAHSGLPLCNCLHAPAWMKFTYFAIGPVYFLACKTYDNITKNILGKKIHLTQ